MTQKPCPYLATLDQNYNQGPPIDYPSFENRCLAGGEQDSLLFPHQATFCLSSGHRLCPLFHAARYSTGRIGKRTEATTWQPARPSRSEANEQSRIEEIDRHNDPVANRSQPTLPTDKPLDSTFPHFTPEDAVLQNESVLTPENGIAEAEWLEGRRRWGWIGAGIVFVVVLIFGGLTAAWAGWNFANAQLEAQPGAVSITQELATATLTPDSSAFVVWTATPPAGAVMVAPILPPAVPLTQSQNGAPNYPVAVTATPPPTNNNNANLPTDSQNSGEAPLIVVQPPDQQAVQLPPSGQVLPDIEVQIPTRRPTPPLELVVDSTSEVEPTPTATETPTPLGTPVIIFGPDDRLLQAGECTTLRWSVQNVHEVYYENLGVNGKGEREECVGSHDSTFTLRVILASGATEIYTTTVTVEQPTPTPTVTETFTPEPVFTPTWTPIPPTEIPTPNIRRGVSIVAQNGSQATCVANSNCAVGLLVSNTGDEIDNLTVQKQAGGDWSAQLCRTDGVCGDQLPLISVGPGNTVFLELRLVIPAEATAGEQHTYQFEATSEGSGGSVRSGAIIVTVMVQ